ncbi:hypothetical protein LTR36_004698 [Oleoguttula mirabilis]|uniref:Uncharacterized protein n=1 Tax=Oleoguttula mirabilis TaxID=1507867 RepID=A0AAV9JF29_9PEZI|nr:hypothetical protein LTR36_004698 [Oleoguttula mirabilis]
MLRAKPFGQKLFSRHRDFNSANSYNSVVGAIDRYNIQPKPPQLIKRHFDLAILSVNKQLHDEAKEYLFKAHTFILVTHKWLTFGGAEGPLQHHKLPVITNVSKTAMNFKNTSLHLDLSCDSGAWAPDAGQQGVLIAQPGAFIITETEFGMFCRILQRRFFNMRSKAVYLDSKPTEDALSRRPVVSCNDSWQAPLVTTNVKFITPSAVESARSSRETSMARILQENLRGACQAVQLEAYSQGSIAAKAMVRSMSPDIIRIKALAYSLLLVVSETKDTADELAKRGSWRSAVALYFQLVQDTAVMSVFAPAFKSGVEAARRCPEYANHILQIATTVCDAALTGGWILLRQHDIPRARALAFQPWTIYGKLIAEIRQTFTPLYEDDEEPRNERALAYFHTVTKEHDWHSQEGLHALGERLSNMLSEAPNSAYVAHDLDLVRELLRTAQRTTLTEQLDRPSLCALPLHYFSSKVTNSIPAPIFTDWYPDDLSKDEQSAVHALQGSEGMPRGVFA